jgi:hypothetical protein
MKLETFALQVVAAAIGNAIAIAAIGAIVWWWIA